MIVRIEHLPFAGIPLPGEIEVLQTPEGFGMEIFSVRFKRISEGQFGLAVDSRRGGGLPGQETNYLLVMSFRDLEEYSVWLRSEIASIDVDGERWWNNPDKDAPPPPPAELEGWRSAVKPKATSTIRGVSSAVMGGLR